LQSQICATIDGLALKGEVGHYRSGTQETKSYKMQILFRAIQKLGTLSGKISTFVGSCQSEIPIEGQAQTNDDRADIEAYLERLLLIVGKTRHSLDAHIDNTEQRH